MSSKIDPDSSIAIFVNMHTKRTPLIVLPHIHILFSIQLTQGSSATCAFPRVLYANIKGPKIIGSYYLFILDGEITFQVWQFASFLHPKLGETVICPPLGASPQFSPLTNTDRDSEHDTESA